MKKIVLEQYRKKIHQDHKTQIVRMGFSLYAWFWFHTEFWIKDPEERRPYTFIMRDWIYPHLKAFIVILVIWYGSMLAWLYWNPYPPAVLMALSSWLAAHLVWGSGWKKGEQEWPAVIFGAGK